MQQFPNDLLQLNVYTRNEKVEPVNILIQNER